MSSDGEVQQHKTYDRVVFEPTEMTVGGVIGRCFPYGTVIDFFETDLPTERALRIRTGRAAQPTEIINACKRVPVLPPDVFAVCGVLLNLSGAIHHVSTEPTDRSRVGPLQRAIFLPPRQLIEITSTAKKWREMELPEAADSAAAILGASPAARRMNPPPKIHALWDELHANWDVPVFTPLPQGEPPPQWWSVALQLFIAADEAARGIGFDTPGRSNSPLWRLFAAYLTLISSGNDRRTGDTSILDSNLEAGRFTISTISPDILCVLPKSRTAQVGCTLRSLSHHLALLPPRGLARAQWIQPPGQKAFPLCDDSAAMNLLLVPIPYDLPPQSIMPVESYEEDPLHPWGWFAVIRAWGPGDNTGEPSQRIITHISALAESSKNSVGPINAIVLPELALDFKTFALLCRRVLDATDPLDPFHSVEMIVAGLRNDNLERPGNFAGACIFSKVVKAPNEKPFRTWTMSLQPKHHRWRLDRRQLDMYGFGATLSSALTWWESIPLLSRSISIMVFRPGATMVPLICEDLARLEPVHDLVRSIGPTLVIALLMDGPQISARWPGRYAMGLADDPGSSVLTLTSFGTVARSARASDAPSRSIGLFRDDHGDTRQLELPKGTCGVVLTLSCQRALEYTLDGRTDEVAARRWIYSAQRAVTVEKCEENKWAFPD